MRVPKLTVRFSHSSLHANRYRAFGATATQLRGALTACHDTVTKEQKRAAAAARGHAEERSRLQQEIMDLTKARDVLKAQLQQAESQQASLARRAKLAEEETARAKRTVERVSNASEKSASAGAGDATGAKTTRDSVRVLASDSLRREAEHKLATQTLQARAPLALAPVPLVFSYKSETSVCRAAARGGEGL